MHTMISQMVTIMSSVIFLGLVVGIPLWGLCRKIKVYDIFVDGAREGFQVAIRIIPYLIAMMVAIGMLRASGALDIVAQGCAPLLQYLRVPPDILTLALMRPFSGSASNGLLADIIHTYGPDSFAAQVAATIMGSTETTFYVIAVYFGAVGIKRVRHSLVAGLIADTVGILASLWICRILF